MKHITLTTVERFFTSAQKVTLNVDHIVSIEPEGEGSLVRMYRQSEPYEVQETEEQIRTLIAANEAKPAQPAPEPPKEPKA